MYILSHTSPDGDAIGASFGLAALLTIQCTIVFYGTKPLWFDAIVQELQPETKYIWNTPITPQIIIPPVEDYIQWAGGNNKTYSAQWNNDDHYTYSNTIVVDAQSTTRSGIPEYTPLLIIDHHNDEQDKAWINVSAPGISSTCELITSFLTDGSPIKLAGDIHRAAPWLILGIISDTFSFRINVTKDTINRLLFLFSCTNAFGTIQQIINRTKPKHYIHTVKHALNTYKEINSNTVFVMVNTEDKDQVTLVMEIMRMYYENVFIVYTQNNKYALSARTRDDTAYRVASAIGGGGHTSAAGAVTDIPLDKIEYTIRKHATQGMP